MDPNATCIFWVLFPLLLTNDLQADPSRINTQMNEIIWQDIWKAVVQFSWDNGCLIGKRTQIRGHMLRLQHRRLLVKMSFSSLVLYFLLAGAPRQCCGMTPLRWAHCHLKKTWPGCGWKCEFKKKGGKKGWGRGERGWSFKRLFSSG